MRFSPWKPFYLWNTPRVSSPRYFFERRRTSRRSKSHRSFGTTTLKYRSFGISFPERKPWTRKSVFKDGLLACVSAGYTDNLFSSGIPTCVKQASLLPPREWTSARSKPYFPIRCSLAQCLRAMQSSQPHEYVIRACAIESKPIGHSSHLPSRVFDIVIALERSFSNIQLFNFSINFI